MIAAVGGGAAVVAAAVVVIAAVLAGGSPVISTTTNTPAPAAPNPAAMPAAGTVLWTTLTGPTVRLSGEAPFPTGWGVSLAGGTAVIAPGIGYLQSDAGDAADAVLGVNVRTGAVRWRWQRNGWRLEAIAASAADGVAASLWITNPANGTNASGGGFSYALTVLDLRTGRLAWTSGGAGSGASGGRTVIVGHEVIVLADHTVSAFAASGGRALWRRAAPAGCNWGFDTGGATGSEITLGDAAVFPYVCGDSDSTDGGNGGIVRLVPATGATVWQRRLPGPPRALAQAAGSAAVIVSPSSSAGPAAQVFDVATGRMRFSTPVFVTQEYAGMLAVDRSGNVYLLAAGPAKSETLVRVDAADGRVGWSTPIGQPYLALSVGVAGGQVVLGGEDTSAVPRTPELRLFSSATGTMLARQNVFQVTAPGDVSSDWDSALALEPGLVLLSASGEHDMLGAVSFPQLTGAP